MSALWIDDAARLERFCNDIGDEPLALDTESDHFHAYQPQICLIQAAAGQQMALIDPLAMDASELTPLLTLLEDAGVVKILHAARNDIIQFDRDYDVGIANLFDTQIAARFLDYERNSLNWMLEELIGISTGGSFTRYDWTTRPLPAKARRYATDDVRYLGQLRDRFRSELKDEDWIEAFRQQCGYVARSVEYEATAFNPDDWRGLKGSKKLDDRGRAALKELFLWRHELCTKLNKSAVTVFPNKALLRLARKRPTTAAEVSDISGIPRRLKADYGAQIAKIIADSLDSPAPDADPPSTSYTPPPPEQKKRYNALRRWRNETSDKLGIPTEFIATNDTLSAIAAAPPDSLDELGDFDAILPWHMEAFGDEMLNILR